MCKKCKVLMKTWWQKQQNVYNNIGSNGALYERNVAWKALFRQRHKHSGCT